MSAKPRLPLWEALTAAGVAIILLTAVAYVASGVWAWLGIFAVVVSLMLVLRYLAYRERGVAATND